MSLLVSEETFGYIARVSADFLIFNAEKHLIKPLVKVRDATGSCCTCTSNGRIIHLHTLSLINSYSAPRPWPSRA